MSFGKPKSPLTQLTDEHFNDYLIDKLEARMRGDSFLVRCGCTFSWNGRGRLVKRCSYHEQNTEFTPDTPKEKKA